MSGDKVSKAESQTHAQTDVL